MISAKDHILIERFIEGTLTGIELKEFQERMTGNESFRSEVEFYYLLFSGIRRSREEELSNYITSNVSVRHYTPRSVIAIVIVMLIIIVSGVGVWNYLERDAAVNNKHFFTFDFFNKLKNKPTSIDRPKSEKKNQLKDNKTSGADSIASERLKLKHDSAIATNQLRSNDSLTENDNIVIRKDELISTAEIPIINKTQEQKQEGVKGKDQPAGQAKSLSKEAVEKLNPAAQLPEEESAHPSSLQVEFWQSPVNYKGFKLVKNKLVLFGIERPEEVKLYLLNDQLYMQYGQLFSRLIPANDYQSFFVLKESEIPSQLK